MKQTCRSTPNNFMFCIKIAKFYANHKIKLSELHNFYFDHFPFSIFNFFCTFAPLYFQILLKEPAGSGGVARKE